MHPGGFGLDESDEVIALLAHPDEAGGSPKAALGMWTPPGCCMGLGCRRADFPMPRGGRDRPQIDLDTPFLGTYYHHDEKMPEAQPGMVLSSDRNLVRREGRHGRLQSCSQWPPILQAMIVLAPFRLPV